jgi:uncharacterized membrane protein
VSEAPDDADKIDAFIDGAFSFVWRWFWRLVLWAVIAFLGIAALLFFIASVEDSSPDWVAASGMGCLVVIAFTAHEIQKRMDRVIGQNAEIIRLLSGGRKRPVFDDPDWDDL